MDMSLLTLADNSWEDSNALVRDGTKLDPERGTYKLSANTAKAALEVTGAAFALISMDQQFQSHANWLVGDLMWHGCEKWREAYEQELDSFARMVGWSRRRLSLREKISRVFCDGSLRRYSYDVGTWAKLFPQQVKKGIEGVPWPVTWNHYRDAGDVSGLHLQTLCKAVQICWVLREGPRVARTILVAARNQCEAGNADAVDELVEEVLETSRVNGVDGANRMQEMIREAKELNPKGRYVFITLGDAREIYVERCVEITPDRYNNSDLCLKIGGADGLAEVIDYDGITESLDPVEGVM